MATFLSPEFSATLDLMAEVFIGNSGVDQCQQFVEQLRTIGVDAALAARRQVTDLRGIVDGWLATRDWASSEDYFGRHHETLRSDGAGQMLQSMIGAHPAATQYLVLLQLVDAVDVGMLFDAAADADHAIDLAIGQLRNGRPDVAGMVVMLNQSVLTVQPHGGVLMGVLAALQGNVEQATEMVSNAGGEAAARAAYVSAFAECARRDREHADLWRSFHAILAAD